MSPLKITLDTNCIINVFDTQHESPTSVEDISNLMRLALSERIDIAITTRVETDLRKDANEERRLHMLRCLKLFPIVGTTFRWDVSCFDSGDQWATDEEIRLASELQQLLARGASPTDKRFSNKINDVDHLLGHRMNRRDVFVTDDGGILDKREKLKTLFDIVVMRPSECIESLQEADRRRQA